LEKPRVVDEALVRGAMRMIEGTADHGTDRSALYEDTKKFAGYGGDSLGSYASRIGRARI